MKKALITDTLRQVWATKSRFLAIFAIIALGCGFFAGIKVTPSDMQKTAANYWDEQKLSDVHLMSTLGFEEEDIAAIKADSDVDWLYAGYTADLFVEVDDKLDIIVKAYSMDMSAAGGDDKDFLNRPVLLEGRYPTAPNEILADAPGFSHNALSLGSTVKFRTKDVDRPLEDIIKGDTYTVVGVVKSPIYVAFARGATTIGNGVVDAFVLLPEEAFNYEAYTDVFVTLKGAANGALSPFDDEYKDYVADKLTDFEAIGDGRISARTATINKELQDAEVEFADGEKKYNDGLTEYKDGEKKYNDGLTEYADGEKKYKDGLVKFADGEKKYNDGMKEYNDNLAKFNVEIADAQKQLDDGAATLRESRATYEDGLAQYNSGLAQWNTEGAPALAQLEQLAAAGMLDEQNAATLTALKTQKATLDGTAAELAKGEQQLTEGEATAANGQAELNAQKSDGQKKLADAKTELDNAARTLADSKLELDDAAKKLADSKIEIADAAKTLADSKVDLEEASTELEDGRAKLVTSRADVAKLLDDAKWYCFDRESYPEYANYEVDAARIDSIARVFPVFFILVAALVCLTTMTRMVEEQRTKIGILKALGYSRFAIMGQYLAYAIVASVLGGFIGVLVGFKVFPNVIFMAYQNMYVMPSIIAEFRWDYAILCVTAAILCTGISVVAACYTALFSLPSQLMRPQPPKNGKRVILERVGFLWKHLSFNMKVTFRNVFRYKDRVLMTIVGIAGCTALIVAGFGLKYAIGSIVDKQYGEIFRYDVINILDEKAKPDVKKKLDDGLKSSTSMSSTMYALQKLTNATVGKESQEVYLFAPEDSSRMNEFIVLQERVGKKPIKLGDEGVVINEKLGKLLQVKVGDSIVLDDAKAPVTVAAITENYTYNYVYISTALYEKTFEPLVYNTFIANMADGITSDALSEELLSYENILSVNYTDVAGTKFTDLVSSLNLIVFVLILSSGALAFVVLYNLANINVNERIRELATIKVLGFFDGEVSAYVYRESMISSTLGMLVGLVVGAVLERFIVLEAEMDMIMFSHDIPPHAFIISAVLTLFFAVVVNFTMHFKLKKIDMAASMKAIE